ncbi:receptor-like protein EIX2 [Rutidosis leptorrhynchoides]|uniref:receptor-like protein EIX2 n=1 Tax=Rutidosis leptorrhynchoides TaxID=125765 RepID=UPI003A997F62
MHAAVYWLLCILLFVSDVDHSLGLNEDSNVTVTGSCIEKERQALLMFKADLKDINDWRNEEGKMDCCKWPGVYCDTDTGHVTELRLSIYPNLVGKINPSVKLLKQLQTLDLSGIDFQSNQIPNFLSSLTTLQHLHMSNANLSGPIPHQLGNLSKLISLDLSVTGPVPNFGGWSSLTSLLLAHNSLNGSIPDFTGCKSLLKVDLSGNQLSGDLPNSLGQLSNLTSLDVSSNSLHGVISDLHFINLSSITYLDMSFNSISFNLSSDFRIPFQLETIKLQSCKLGPSFPLWIKTQTSFQHLDISSAGISDSVPVWFWDLPLGLKLLNLSSNDLKGTLPNISSDFDQYPGLDLSNNRFEGRVPLLPSKLASLNLSRNKFKGDLSFLCHIVGELNFIDLSSNSFSGSLPDCWSHFQKLVILDLSYNNLSGNIPLSFGFLNQLEALYLRKNAFVGEGKDLPAWVGERLASLYVLVLRSNIFNGILPSQLCLLNNLNILDLSNNGLVGNIPGCVGNFTSMSSKRSGNDRTNHSYKSYHFIPGDYHPTFPGCTVESQCPGAGAPVVYPIQEVHQEFIDNALVAWKGIERSFGRSILELLNIIDLSNNSLSGKLPFEITHLAELVSLNISFNKLHGELPKDIGMLRSLDSLDLSKNQFSGKIPSSLARLDGLGYLDLSFNNLSGKIPTRTQLQGFNSSFYEGNPLLYGPPLSPVSGPTPSTTGVVEDDNELGGDNDFWKSYYMGMGAGFAAGFWWICGLVFFNRRCRHLFFASLSLAQDWIYVTLALFFRKFNRNTKVASDFK